MKFQRAADENSGCSVSDLTLRYSLIINQTPEELLSDIHMILKLITILFKKRCNLFEKLHNMYLLLTERSFYFFSLTDYVIN